MKPIHAVMALGIAAVVAGAPAHADDHHGQARADQHAASGMQAIAHVAQPGQPGHGWRYFADARKHRAVVISPDGDYFHSRGKGLVLVHRALTGPQTA